MNNIHPVCCKKYMWESGSDVWSVGGIGNELVEDVIQQCQYECLDCGKLKCIDISMTNGILWDSFEAINEHHLDILEVDLMIMMDKFKRKLNEIDVSKFFIGRKTIGLFQHFKYPKFTKKLMLSDYENIEDQFICPQCSIKGEELEHGDAYECECGLKFQSFGNALYIWNIKEK